MSGAAAGTSLSRDLAIASVAIAFVLFFLGVLIHASQMLGVTVVWGISVAFLIVAAIAGAHAVLIDRFPPKG